MASLVLSEHILGQVLGRVCMAATIGIQPFTSKYFPKKVYKSIYIAFGRATLVIQLGVQIVSRRLPYIATNTCFKSMCV